MAKGSPMSGTTITATVIISVQSRYFLVFSADVCGSSVWFRTLAVRIELGDL
jgi:hypothetical protein